MSLEASRALAHAAPGRGVVVRAGDVYNTFDNDAERFLRVAREELCRGGHRAHSARCSPAAPANHLSFVRIGWSTTAIAVPNVNYHNQGEHSRRLHTRGRSPIGPAQRRRVARRGGGRRRRRCGGVVVARCEGGSASAPRPVTDPSLNERGCYRKIWHLLTQPSMRGCRTEMFRGTEQTEPRSLGGVMVRLHKVFGVLQVDR